MNRDYIAGFFDGEGSLTKYKNGYRIFITQTNKEVLEEIQNFVKVGNIYEVGKRKAHWKDCWVLSITNHKNVYCFLKKIGPKLIIKKELADEAMKTVEISLKEMERKRIIFINRRKEAKKLRKKGLSYRRIGETLGIDWGHARRLILGIK